MNEIKHSSNPSAPSLARDTRGLSTVEYIIILVLIAVAGYSGWNKFGGKVSQKIDEANTAVELTVPSTK